MKIFKKLILLSFIFLITSCGTLKEGFKNQKKNSSDEFLVEKKSPLVMPPDFDELPIPIESGNKSDTENNNIKGLITENSLDNIDNEIENKDLESSILDKIN